MTSFSENTVPCPPFPSESSRTKHGTTEYVPGSVITPWRIVAQQARGAAFVCHDDAHSIEAPVRAITDRGDTLQGPLLTVTLS